MNQRILKKLSKRAAHLLPLLGDNRKQFRAEPDDSGYFKTAVKTRDRYAMALKGTVMVGAVSGYYEPEWDEETAWCALSQLVRWHFIEVDGETLQVTPTRPLRNPSQIFKAAHDMLGEQI
jgi:hypothetical protein